MEPVLNFYKVVAKCGHVGRSRYCEKAFFVKAEDGRIAAQVVRKKGRVKHDHKDAILSVKKIDETEYVAGRQANKNDPFFNSSNVQQQRQNFEQIAEHIFKETSNVKYKDNKEDRQKRLAAQHRFERKQNKHAARFA
jgi:hypothetical protein